ncbi:ricin-type beta-trefoil lectin domain protein [Kitasatospora sp. RB6PN24]|nr:ricin-type beta-trefoil lectin domain protein [Kitasatospora humi]
MQGSTLTAAIDDTEVGTAGDSSYANGRAGLGITGYQTDQFDDFSVAPGADSGPHVGPVASGLAGKCLDDNADTAAGGTIAQIWDCDGGAAQAWTYGNGTVMINDKCLNVTGGATADGTSVELESCNGSSSQQWIPQADGSLKGGQSGRCLDDPAFRTANGTELEVWDCNGGANQRWTLP